MQAIISVRKITNGYIVSTRAANQNGMLGSPEQAESFYPSYEALHGDFDNVLQSALSEAEEADRHYRDQIALARNQANAKFQYASAECASQAIR